MKDLVNEGFKNIVKPYIDNQDKKSREIIAPVEVSPAEASHAVGTQLIYDGILYDVTTAIAIGDVLAAGTNITAADDISTKMRSVKHDFVGLYGENAFTSATDLDTVTTVGNYYKARTDFAVTNAPTEISEDVQAKFRLTVEKMLHSTGDELRQTLTAVTGEIYRRIYGGATWGIWELVPNAEELDSRIGTTTTKTLAANATSVEFNVPTTGNNLIDFFISDGSFYTAIDTSVTGKVTLTFEAKASARDITCRIAEV